MGEREKMLIERADRIAAGNDRYPTDTPRLLRETADLISSIRDDLAAEQRRRSGADRDREAYRSRALAAETTRDELVRTVESLRETLAMVAYGAELSATEAIENLKSKLASESAARTEALHDLDAEREARAAAERARDKALVQLGRLATGKDALPDVVEQAHPAAMPAERRRLPIERNSGGSRSRRWLAEFLESGLLGSGRTSSR